MFNIRGLGSLRPGEKKEKKEKTKKGSSGQLTNKTSPESTNTSSSFVAALSEAEENILNENIHQFIDAIERQGDKLKRHPNRMEFIRYKTLISRFLKKIIAQSMKINKRKVYRRDRELVSATIINEQLFELGHFVLLEEADTLRVAEKIDSIKGLLYDSMREAGIGENQ